MSQAADIVDVVVPVYRGVGDTRRCLESVLASACRTAFEIVVVDDASPEPQLSAYLDRLADEGRIVLLRNGANRGFVASVNRGMSLHRGRDVVLLNSDTEVANDWLDRIAACARSAANVATATPFSNNATICSYPFDGWTGEVPGTLGLAGLDRLIARVNARVTVELPTAVGFCMYIRREALDSLGLFDEARFGRGYGEENDFSLRAAKAGWRNLLCADVFVYHRGGVSFGSGRHESMRRAEQALLAVHPDYNERVATFVAADPVRPLREAMDRARREAGAAEAEAVTAEQAGLGDGGVRYVGWRPEPDRPARAHERHGRPVVLHVAHSWGGGVDRWVRDFANADEQGWNLVLRSRTSRADAGVRIELVDVLADDEPLLAWDLDPPIGTTAVSHAGYRGILDRVVATFGVEAVIVSSLIGHSLDAFDTGRPTVVVLHDFYPFCPALFGWFGGECRSCDGGALRRCADSNPLNVFWHHDRVDAWTGLRDAYAARLVGAAVRVVAPSRAVHDRYATLFPALAAKPWELIEHGLGVVPARPPQPEFAPLAADRRLRVLVPGRLLLHKGLRLIETALPALAGFADVLLLGCGDFGRPFAALAHVEVVPDYPNADLAAQVARFAPDCALLASVLPETFSYTLSEMQALGVPTVATALGAFAERIRDGETGFLVAPDADAAVARLRELAASPSRLERVAATLRAMPVRTASRMVGDYRRLFSPAGRPRAGAESGAAQGAGELVDALQRQRGHQREMEQERRRIEETAALAQTRAAALASELTALRAALAQSQADAAHLGRRVVEVEAARVALLDSTSWRLTRPLRAVRSAISAPRSEAPSAAPVAPVVGGSASEPAARAVEPAARRIVFRDSDPLAMRRAGWLAARLGLAAEARPVLLPDDPERDAGVTLALGRAGGDAPAPTFVAEAICYEGGAAAPANDDPERGCARVAVPSSSIVLSSNLARGERPRIVEFPLVCAPFDEARRAAERLRCRVLLGIPDRMRVVLGIGRGDARSGLLQFARTANAIAERSNGCCFVWAGGADAGWMRTYGPEIGVAVSLRRLFLVPEDAVESWLLAADAYLGCRSAGVYDAGAPEALAAGLPVAVEEAGSLPDALRSGSLAEALDLVVGEGVSGALAEWSRRPFAPRLAVARRVRERFGSAGLAAAFLGALGGPEGDSEGGLQGASAPGGGVVDASGAQV